MLAATATATAAATYRHGFLPLQLPVHPVFDCSRFLSMSQPLDAVFYRRHFLSTPFSIDAVKFLPTTFLLTPLSTVAVTIDNASFRHCQIATATVFSGYRCFYCRRFRSQSLRPQFYGKLHFVMIRMEQTLTRDIHPLVTVELEIYHQIRHIPSNSRYTVELEIYHRTRDMRP
jgi:hypothetical protein